MTDLATRREEAHKALLDLFASTTGLPIGLFEPRDGTMREVISDRSLAAFEEHCQFIRSLPGGAARCERDQCLRAEQAIHSAREQLTLCHAGLYNQAVPIEVGGEVRAVLLYGEMLVDDDEHIAEALRRHEQTVKELEIGPEDAQRLRELLLQAKRYSQEDLDAYKTLLSRVERLLYLLFDEEAHLKRSVEKVTHEIQTRLQAVIANAENLTMELDEMSREEARQVAEELLHSALALDTVVQNLGEYMEEYRFRSQPLAPLLWEAKRLYEAEANRRGIDIRLRIQGNPVLELSRHHMQYALNNLIHNAVKYSFRSGPGRHRYVLVLGRPEEDYYMIMIENYGVGILPEEIENGAIFQDGYQGKLTQGEYRTGSGKGLHFVKRVIDRHHGRIRVTSRLVSEEQTPEGQPHLTRFFIYLPYVQPRR